MKGQVAQLRERQWAEWMRAALAGDEAVYRLFLRSLTPVLRAMVQRRAARFGVAMDAEDVVQEVLLTVHLKRHTWDASRPIGPWISVIARNKLIDALRRRDRRIQVSIEDVADVLEAEDDSEQGLERRDVERLLGRLKPSQADIVRAVSIEDAGIRETAERLAMSEGAVRVALHRALKTLARLYRNAER